MCVFMGCMSPTAIPQGGNANGPHSMLCEHLLGQVQSAAAQLRMLCSNKRLQFQARELHMRGICILWG